jgi:putative flavoprotein involved in K+ transport
VEYIDTVIIGAGQAGLAMSRSLSDRDVEHVILERGRVAERWRSERWDSLRLLTPNWQTRLPGFRYEGSEADGYMSMPQLIDFFERYAASFDAPVELGTTVNRVESAGSCFRVETSHGTWRARHVVIATGYSDVPFVPSQARQLSPRIAQVVPTHYRNPAQLPAGGVLVIGASATGVQLAEEIQGSGREVTLAVGRHQRLPRRYRGRDILWWLDAMGVFDATADDVFDISTSRRQPSLQLVGRADLPSLDISVLRQRGIRVVGRLLAIGGERVQFDDDLIATAASSDVKLAEMLLRIDAFIASRGMYAELAPAFEPTWPSTVGVRETTVDLRAAGIHTVVWATGFSRRYPWLKLPVFDSRGEVRHRAGVTPVPGLFILGMHFQRRRKSAFIDGVGGDAVFLADRIASRERSIVSAAAS